MVTHSNVDRRFQLLDDSTMDTVVMVVCLDCRETWEERLCQDVVALYRADDGSLSQHKFERLCEDLLDDIPCPECEED